MSWSRPGVVLILSTLLVGAPAMAEVVVPVMHRCVIRNLATMDLYLQPDASATFYYWKEGKPTKLEIGSELKLSPAGSAETLTTIVLEAAPDKEVSFFFGPKGSLGLTKISQSPGSSYWGITRAGNYKIAPSLPTLSSLLSQMTSKADLEIPKNP